MYRRNLGQSITDAMGDTPVVLLIGARQTGKSTLAREMNPASAYVTFDDTFTLASARDDPQGFVRALPRPVVLDEIQLVPEIFRSIKAEVDRDRQAGSFLLTGSANVFLLPRLAESLAGRMEVLTLWPLSQGEIEGTVEGFIDILFSDKPLALLPSSETRQSLLRRAITGGYPELVVRRDPRRRAAWLRSYTTTVLQRDVRDLANIEALTELPRLLRLLAARAGSLLNVASLSNEMAVPQTSLRRYLNLLQATFVVQTLPAWSTNVGRRSVRTPKFFLNDAGLLAHLTGIGPGSLPSSPDAAGPLMESFVVMELRKQATWSDQRPEIFFFRTHDGLEVDVLLENAAGQIVGIEVKASASPQKADFRGLTFLRDVLGDRFVRGVLLYTGEHTLPFGDRLWAMPVDALWRLGALPQTGDRQGSSRALRSRHKPRGGHP